MIKLIILDFSDCSVHIYDIDGAKCDDAEELVTKLGFNPRSCEWMIGNMEITYHKETIK